jgi:hypothetical protein
MLRRRRLLLLFLSRHHLRLQHCLQCWHLPLSTRQVLRLTKLRQWSRPMHATLRLWLWNPQMLLSDKPLPSASEQELEDDAASKSGRYFTSEVQVGKTYVEGCPNTHIAMAYPWRRCNGICVDCTKRALTTLVPSISTLVDDLILTCSPSYYTIPFQVRIFNSSSTDS